MNEGDFKANVCFRKPLKNFELQASYKPLLGKALANLL